MTSMSYCRWRNTLEELRACDDCLNEQLEPEEADARAKVLQIAAQMLSFIGQDIDFEELKDQIKLLPVENEHD